jgi:hypothetical protein
VHRVSPLDGWLRTLLDIVGPPLGTFSASGFGGMRELLLALRDRDGRKGEEPNRAPGVPFRWTATIPPCIQYGRDLFMLISVQLR